MSASATIVVDIPTEAHVGDTFHLTARARIVQIRDVLIETTLVGGPTSFASGEREYELLVTDTVLTALEP